MNEIQSKTICKFEKHLFSVLWFVFIQNLFSIIESRKSYLNKNDCLRRKKSKHKRYDTKRNGDEKRHQGLRTANHEYFKEFRFENSSNNSRVIFDPSMADQ